MMLISILFDYISKTTDSKIS